MSRLLRFFDSITIDDAPQVGGKNASLGEMVRSLSGKGVPNGFATTPRPTGCSWVRDWRSVSRRSWRLCGPRTWTIWPNGANGCGG